MFVCPPPLTEPREFERAYDEHGRSVYAAALRILGSPALAQDVTQDVFLRLWRKPEAFDARRGGLGPYLRLMARSRALDLWREGQAAGRMTDRLMVVAIEPERGRRRAGAGGRAQRGPRQRPRRAARLPPAQREALVLAYWGGMTADEIARRSQVPLGDGEEPDPARPGAVAPGVRAARRLSDAASHEGPDPPLSSNARSTAEPRAHEVPRAGDPIAAAKRRHGANPRLLPR